MREWARVRSGETLQPSRAITAVNHQLGVEHLSLNLSGEVRHATQPVARGTQYLAIVAWALDGLGR